LDVEERDRWVRWQQVDFIAGQPSDARVYQLNAQTGHVVFGDSQRGGMRPPFGARIRVAQYRYGGGDVSNLPAQSITEVVDASSKLTVHQALPLTGGVPAETVEQAEKRIPQFLTHRNRAVSQSDFKLLTEANPVNPVAKAQVVPGFLPAMELNASRSDVPGVVSVFVMPPANVHVAPYPKPTVGLLKDIYNYLTPKLMLGTELYVLSPEFIPVAVSIVVQVTEPENELTILEAIKKAVTEYLWPVPNNESQGWELGHPVRANEAAIEVARVQGVKAVNGLNIFSADNEQWKPVTLGQGLVLSDYQLPEMVGIRVVVGTSADQAILPEGLKDYFTKDSASGISIPVIPELC
jgi:predicted phage baseplate assembly protein